MMERELEELWVNIEGEHDPESHDTVRIYRRLSPVERPGLRLGLVMPGRIRELLIELGPSETTEALDIPRWKGMKFETIHLDISQQGTRHLRIFLEAQEHRPIFTIVCADIAQRLIEIGPKETWLEELQRCIERWNRFFQHHGMGGLSLEAQRGLYGELILLGTLLSRGMDAGTAVESWRGCERSFHDFENTNGVIEVKTTMTKEPRHVMIGNERQLDDRGIKALHLFVLTLHMTKAGQQSLPELINELRTMLEGAISVETGFERALHAAGYLDIHAAYYDSRYTIKDQEAFRVLDGFPRLIQLPSGVGDVTYALYLSGCTEFKVETAKMYESFMGCEPDG